MKKEKEMSFIDHLEELRWHIIRSLLAIIVFAIIAFVSKEIVFGIILLGPSKSDFWTYQALCNLGQQIGVSAFCIDELPFIIQSRQMAGQFMMHISSSFVIGIIFAFPYAFWEFWRFISPGLYVNEKKAARGATFYVSLLFFIGVMFGYFILTPISINFLANYQIDPSILNEFDIISYVSTITTLVLASGMLFQLPMVIYFSKVEKYNSFKSPLLIIKAKTAAKSKTNPDAASNLKKYLKGFVMCWIIAIIYFYRDHLSIAKKA